MESEIEDAVHFKSAVAALFDEVKEALETQIMNGSAQGEKPGAVDLWAAAGADGGDVIAVHRAALHDVHYRSWRFRLPARWFRFGVGRIKVVLCATARTHAPVLRGRANPARLIDEEDRVLATRATPCNVVAVGVDLSNLALAPELNAA